MRPQTQSTPSVLAGSAALACGLTGLADGRQRARGRREVDQIARTAAEPAGFASVSDQDHRDCENRLSIVKTDDLPVGCRCQSDSWRGHAIGCDRRGAKTNGRNADVSRCSTPIVDRMRVVRAGTPIM